MSVFNSNVSVDFLNPIDPFTSININALQYADSQQVVFGNTDTTHSVFAGSFSYPAPGTIDGSINSMGWVSPEYGSSQAYQTYMSLTGFTLPVNTFIAYLNYSFELRILIFGGNDALNGSAADDRMLGFNGNDLIYGNDGNDDVNGNQGNDTVWGGFGNDNVRGGKDQDYVDGQGGNDTVNGNIGNDTVRGGDGDDWVLGGQNEDLLYGEAGNDLLSGDLGNDTLYGGAGADAFLFNLGAGSDVIMDFEQGLDAIYVTAALAATVGNSFAAAASYVGADTILRAGGVEIRILNAHLTEFDVAIV